MIEGLQPCLVVDPPTVAYTIAQLLLVGVAVVLAFGAGGAVVWWRMTGLKGRSY